MQSEHLHQWLIATKRYNFPDTTNWLKVVDIVQEEFQEWMLAKECMWKKVVLIQKRKGGFQGIGLVEILWKAVASLLNCRLTAAITYHDALHRFWAGRGTGTAALKAKLLQHLTAMMEAVLFELFLDIQKAYNALDR